MSEEHNRAEFETKCRKLGYRVVREENGYLAVDTDQLWVFWKAALAERDNLTKVTRLEVIDAGGRSYTNHKVTSLEFSFQDDDKTLKIFIKE